MKILIYTPIWKRPEIVKLYLESLKRLDGVVNYDLLVVMSPEDPFYWQIIDMLPEETYIKTHKNKPFGAKKNAGIEVARMLDWDYLMELNSDSIVNPAIFDLYKSNMEEKTPFFGLNNLFAVDYYTRECIFIPSYNEDMTFGSGRMLHKDYLIDKPWLDELNEGMDSNMRTRLLKFGIKEEVVDCGEIPMIVDIKTDTSIWHFDFLKQRSRSQVSYKFLTKYIGYDFIGP